MKSVFGFIYFKIYVLQIKKSVFKNKYEQIRVVK